jgi:hypothetical protein
VIAIPLPTVFWASEGDEGENKYGPPMAEPVPAPA